MTELQFDSLEIEQIIYPNGGTALGTRKFLGQLKDVNEYLLKTLDEDSAITAASKQYIVENFDVTARGNG